MAKLLQGVRSKQNFAMQDAQDLTDAEIVKMLEEEGIVIARCTVNKYRQTRKIT